MNVLRIGSRGSEVELLQLALQRAGYYAGSFDGVFGRATQNALQSFQRSMGLNPDGVAGRLTHAALHPWYTGYLSHRIRAGDTYYRLALRYNTGIRAIETANPESRPDALSIGATLIIPLSFPVVPTNISYSSSLVRYCCQGLTARYPFMSLGEMGKSVMGRSLYTLRLGQGDIRVFYNAAHHANEWITTPVLLRYAEDLAHALAYEEDIDGQDARELMARCTVCLAPAVNPDGIDLVTGALSTGPYYERTRSIADDYPEIPFPSGWKANILGTDLNLQYPAGWSQAKEIKYAQGFISPAPRDYVGSAPLSAQESRSVYDFTLNFSPVLTLSYHTQGQVIFWKYLNYEPPLSRSIAYQLSQVSGYAVEDTPYASGFAGYKDWFIQEFYRPGYTIEAGIGTNPLPLSQWDEIYADNRPLMTQAMVALL